MAELVVAVLTYRRNAELAALVPELVAQVNGTGREGRVLVVDNDPQASAHDVVGALGLPRVDYVCEPVPGIASARNRALDEAANDRLLIFVDDDEWPCPGWLTLLVSAYEQYKAGAVVGSVESEFDVEPSPWVRAGNFFRRRRLPTGTRVDVAATNNLLLDMDEVRRLGLRFDEAFGLSGGSDTLFTRQLVAQGVVMVWCDEALVVDKVPAARVSRKWVLRRALRSGNSWARTSVELQPTALQRWQVRLRVGGDGVVRAAAGTLQFLLGLVTARTALQANGARRAMRGAGMASGAFGHVYVEYKRASKA